ncbi:MAG: alpha-L-fucosidase [Candidatus Hydrogenedentes bacterium]|nr:alpha-L-fucosidase [Candidatus Hydrogenedentota bacterium]
MNPSEFAENSTVQRCDWWQMARFGLFIHWGVYAVPARGEWVMYQEHFSNQEYARLADQFCPTRYCPADWVAVARDAGMKYAVLTTRHHDGFCLFDSAVSDFTAPKTAAKRDLVAEFAEACHRAGMRLGFYYSLEDWRFPGQLPHLPVKEVGNYSPMVEQAHGQIRELCTNYGPLDILWLDGAFPPGIWRANELIGMVRSLQPNILVNDRSGAPGDFATPENDVTPHARPWEACYTMNDTWGYAANDNNYKSAGAILRLLVSCVAHGGNFLLNVGPDAAGSFPPQAVEILRQIGDWMRVNKESIYGAGRSPVVAPAIGWTTRVGRKVFLQVQRWPGATVALAWCGSRVKSARLLATGQSATIEQKEDRVWLHGFPEAPPDPSMAVIELTFDEEPRSSVPGYS